MPMSRQPLLRSAAAILLAVALSVVVVTVATAKDVTARDLARDNEKLQRELEGMKTGYLMLNAGQPTLSMAEIVTQSLTARNYNQAYYLRQIVLRPAEALPLLLAQLNDPGFGQLGMQEQGAVLNGLWLIGDPAAVPPILARVDETENPFNRHAWLALLFLPGNAAAVDRALAIAANTQLPFYLRRLPSGYLALNRVEQARPIATAMMQSEDVEEQAAGIWILGSLGDDIREPAVALLAQRELDYGHESGPLDALADQVGPDDMRQLVPEFRQGGESWRTALNRSALLHALPADPGQRTMVCYNNLDTDMPLPWDVAPALKCLLQLDRQDLILKEILITGDSRGSLVLAQLQRQGWSLQTTDKAVFLQQNNQ